MEKCKVLVVEDDALIRMAMIDMVADIGFASLDAGDGPEALRLLADNDDIAFLLTDLGLPGMSGRQLAAASRRFRPDNKVIMASCYAPDDPADAAVTHLRKPFGPAQLRRALES
jgi:CheY-like chemotaxis protein